MLETALNGNLPARPLCMCSVCKYIYYVYIEVHCRRFCEGSCYGANREPFRAVGVVHNIYETGLHKSSVFEIATQILTNFVRLC